MSNGEKYENLVLGSGAAGPALRFSHRIRRRQRACNRTLRHHPLFSAHDSRMGTHLEWLSRAVSNARTIPAQGHRTVRRLSVVPGRVSQGHRGMTPSLTRRSE